MKQGRVGAEGLKSVIAKINNTALILLPHFHD